MIKTNKFYKCPYKEPPVPIMDMHVHTSDRWLFIDLLHKVYGRATLQRDFRGERLKKNVSYSITGEGGDTIKNSEHAL